MKTLSARAQLLALSVTCLALVAGLSVLVVLGSRSDSAALRSLYEHSFQPMLALQEIDRQLKELRFRLAGVLLEQIPVPGSRNHLKEVRERAPALWKGYASGSGSLRGEHREVADRIDRAWKNFDAFAAQLEAAYAANDRKKLATLLEDGWPPVHLELVKPLESLLPIAIKDAEEVYAQQSASATRRQMAAIAGFVITGLLLAAFMVRFDHRLKDAFGAMAVAMRRLAAGDLTVRVDSRAFAETVAIGHEFRGALEQLHGLVERIRSTSVQLESAAQEIAQGHTDLSTRTEEQASSLEQTAASMEQMTATVAQNAENAKKANQLATGASEVAARGGQAVGAVVGTMSGISESSKKIADIIGVIDGIAFQTNILALNAAVEAARAGEQGRGFAVVASEVRSLAQRSAGAAKEIRQLISDSVGRIEEGSRQVEDAGETMAEIVTAVKRVTDLIAEISAASQEQSQSLSQVSDTVQQLEKVTQQNAAMVEEATAASDSLREQAVTLTRAVGGFKLAQEAQAQPAPNPARVAAPVPTPAAKPGAGVALPRQPRPASEGDSRPSRKGKDKAGEGWEEF